jgi:glycosyltransferase involved in cell wall biosynthesis
VLELSVVLCTYKRYDLARNCLQFLAQQTLARNRFEVVVIDNTPPDLREAIDWQALGADQAEVEDQAGLSRARNAGIAHSRAPLIAFIDDDAEASPTWAAEMVEAFRRHPEALVVGGRVTAKYVGQQRPAWLSQRLEGHLSCIDWGPGTKPLERGQWVVGANMTFRQEVFERYGQFNASLGRIGHGTLLSNEEIQLFSRLPANSIYYTSKAAVDHLIPPDRVDQAWFRKRTFWQAVSDQLAGIGASETAASYFERFASRLPTVPAEDRSMRALHRACTNAAEFEQQLDMIYALTMASGLGLPTAASAHRVF